jgi:hypothetical protein
MTKKEIGTIVKAIILTVFPWMFIFDSIWIILGISMIMYVMVVTSEKDEEDKKNAIKNGDDLSRWPKEKAWRDFQERLNKFEQTLKQRY